MVLSRLFDYAITYVVIWWVLWFMVLPFGVQDRPNPKLEASLGQETGAPPTPNLKRKALIVSLIALVATLLVQHFVADWL